MTGLVPFLLQVDLSDMWTQNSSGSNSALIFLIFIVVIIIVILVLNFTRRRNVSVGKETGVKIASPFAVRRLIKSIGLDHEQSKMMNYIIKLDDVVDPERSLASPALLDQHFRRAYRAIDSSTIPDTEIQHRLSVLFSTRNILENTTIGAATSSRQIKEETKLTITHNKEKIAAVVHSAREDFLAVEVPKTVLGSQIKIAKGTKVEVLFFNKGNKGFTFESRVIGYVTLHGHPVMQLAHSNNLRMLSKRRFRRKQSVIACMMFLVYVEGTKKKQRLIVDKRRIVGKIADISVGGCSVKTTVPVQVGARFKIEFMFGDEKMAALGQILRTNRAGINHVVHVKFLRLTQKSMNRINAFVYDYVQE